MYEHEKGWVTLEIEISSVESLKSSDFAHGCMHDKE